MRSRDLRRSFLTWDSRKRTCVVLTGLWLDTWKTHRSVCQTSIVVNAKNKKEVSEQNIIIQIQLPYLSLRIIDMSVIHMAVTLYFHIYTMIMGDNHIRSDIYSGRKTQVGYCVCTVELFPSTVEFSYLIAQINFFYNSSSDHVGCSKSHILLFFVRTHSHTLVYGTPCNILCLILFGLILKSFCKLFTMA